MGEVGEVEVGVQDEVGGEVGGLLLSPGGGILREKTRRLTNPAVPYLELELVLTFFCRERGGGLAGGLGLVGEVLVDFDSLADLAAAEEEEDPRRRTRGGDPERARACGGEVGGDGREDRGEVDGEVGDLTLAACSRSFR